MFVAAAGLLVDTTGLFAGLRGRRGVLGAGLAPPGWC